MKYSLWKILLIFLFLPLMAFPQGGNDAIKGLTDLSSINPEEEFIVKLTGEWEFYWKKILHPHDFEKGLVNPYHYGKVPSYWSNYPKGIVGDGKVGYATYRLIVLLPSGYRKPLGFDMPVFDSSYDIYINDRYIGGNGIPGKSAEESSPEYRRFFFRYEPVSDTLSIIINVSNYSHRRGGFWLPIKMGTFAKVQKQVANTWARDWAVMSLLIGFSLFFFLFYILNRKEKVMAYFSLAISGLALRPLFTSHYLINNLFDPGWIWTVRLEYLDLFMILAGWMWFVTVLYEKKYFRLFTIAVSTAIIIAFLLTLILPVRLFSYSVTAIYPVMLILIIYALIQSISGIILGNRLDIAYFLAFLLLSIAGIHDIRVSLGKAHTTTDYVLTYAVIIFVFIQSALILYRWVKSYKEKEKLQNDLEFINRNLEMMVNERTRELQDRNEEIEKQNFKIAAQNRQLSETIQMKNKIFSVIAHDLRSPVVNILYMLNLLKEKEYKEKYDTFANSSIQYAQMVITLLENMLVWGRGQEDKIKYSPESRNLADIILTNLSIFKESADKKDISMNFTQVGSSIAYFDKDLMDIIIRNLLSNAIKYTARGGRISILLKDRSQEGGGILLKICDNGTGIPAERQKYLFTAAEISSTPGTEDERGTGFGLKLCNELVRLNKGSITVESKEGEGSCFSIILPETP